MGWAGFYLTYGLNGLGIMDYQLVNGPGWARLKEKTQAHDPAHGQCPFCL